MMWRKKEMVGPASDSHMTGKQLLLRDLGVTWPFMRGLAWMI
jgi:hypothetical protein